MKIQRLQITIEPWGLDASLKAIRVKVSADGIVHSAIIYADHSGFVSEFDFYMNEARREILRLVKPDEMQ